MRRREFLSLFGCVVAGWPLELGAQQAKAPVIGFLSGRSPEDSVHVLAAFRRGLRESGFVDGHNATLEFRWARGRYDELPAMASDLANQQVDVLVGVAVAHNAAKLLTTTIPVVFVMGGDPVKAGLVKSFNRPGGNVTGSVISGITEMEPKKLGLPASSCQAAVHRRDYRFRFLCFFAATKTNQRGRAKGRSAHHRGEGEQ